MRSTILLALLAVPIWAADFTLTILHVNDTHDRVEPTIIQGKPYGGMARLGTLVAQYRKSDPNVLLLHGGDAFQGTLYFNVYEGLADLAFLNALRPDAMTLGNHEFDRGPVVLGKFMRYAEFPVVSANIDVDAEPELTGLVKSSVVVSRGGERIGIVGAITPLLPNISSPGPNVKMRDLATSVQAAADALTKQKINKIILLTHVGYEGEQELARTIHGVDVVVGGHSHTLLGNVTAPGWPASSGPYPTVVKNADGGTTLVVQSWEWEKVMGRIQVVFDKRGRVKKWVNAAPIIVDEKVAEEPAFRGLVEAFQKPIVQLRDKKIAVAETLLPKEEAMGEVIADSMKAATASQKVVAAFMNAGGIRSSIEPGDITFGMAISVQPFNNTMVVMDLTGAQIASFLDEPIRPVLGSEGVTYTFDGLKPAGSRITELRINGQPVVKDQVYRVVVNNFMANGGDNFATLKNSAGYRYDTGLLDIDGLVEYMGLHSPLRAAPTRRVRVISRRPE